MSVAEVSRDRVEERLVALEEGYSSFSVNQTTLTVDSDAYDLTRKRCRDGIVDAYVQVYDDAEDVLLVDRAGEWVVPHGRVRLSERIGPGTERAVRERTGVDCSVTDLRRVTILGVRDEADPERPPVYRLIAVFVARADRGATAVRSAADEPAAEGTLPEDAKWHPTLPESAVPSP